MKLHRKVPEAAMVAAFLKAELTSPRFSSKLHDAMRSVGAHEAQIAHPDIANELDNEVRADVLSEYRGYRRNRWLFGGFPDKMHWYEAELMRSEIGDLRYVDYSYWNEITDHTHLVKDAVINIQKGKTVFDVPNDYFLSVANDIRQGKHDFEPIIIWGKTIDSPFEILEGHVRATAFGLAGDNAPATIPVIVGLMRPPNR